MRTKLSIIGVISSAAALAVCVFAATAHAAPLEVGPNQTYATPCAAIAAAQANDVIEVAPGTYTDSCSIGVAGLTLRGVGGQPKIDLSATDHPEQYKGIYVIGADDVTIENLELSGAHISADNGENAAALRVEAKGLTVRGCYLHDNQNGILGGTTGTLTIEHTEFFNNGLGNGCNAGGCTHNLYVSNIDALYFRFNWSHHVATDTPDKGHLLKSRAKANYILYNRLSGEDGFDSYELDLPNGGLAVIVGNVLQKGPNAGNPILLNWGEEGASNPDKRVFIAFNTFVNDATSGRFLSAAGATLTAADNLFIGSGDVGSASMLSPDNLSGVDPHFVDRAHYDYHLLADSPALGKAVAVGMADQLALTPTSEYLQPLQEAARASTHDVGAFEYAVTTPLPDAGSVDAGDRDASASAGSSGTRDDAGGSTQRDAATPDDAAIAAPVDGGESSSHATGDDNDGCSCSVLGMRTTRPVAPWAFGLAFLALLLARARRAHVRRHAPRLLRYRDRSAVS